MKLVKLHTMLVLAMSCIIRESCGLQAAVGQGIWPLGEAPPWLGCDGPHRRDAGRRGEPNDVPGGSNEGLPEAAAPPDHESLGNGSR